MGDLWFLRLSFGLNTPSLNKQSVRPYDVLTKVNNWVTRAESHVSYFSFGLKY